MSIYYLKWIFERFECLLGKRVFRKFAECDELESLNHHNKKVFIKQMDEMFEFYRI